MNLFRKIVHTFIAAILLMATIGVTFNKHYCLGRLKSVAIYLHPPSCAQGEAEQMPCCEDTSQEFKIKETTRVAFDAQTILRQVAVINFTWTRFKSLFSDWGNFSFHYDSPPFPDVDYQVRHQVFLI